MIMKMLQWKTCFLFISKIYITFVWCEIWPRWSIRIECSVKSPQDLYWAHSMLTLTYLWAPPNVQHADIFYFLFLFKKKGGRNKTARLWANFLETDLFSCDCAGERIRFVSLNTKVTWTAAKWVFMDVQNALNMPCLS